MMDDFSTRYRLLKCVLVEDGTRTHNAQELTTGRVVMVHITDAAGPDEVDALRAQLAMLPTNDKNRVLETATLPSGFAVVTEFLPAGLSFRGWLNSYSAPSLPSNPSGLMTATGESAVQTIASANSGAMATAPQHTGGATTGGASAANTQGAEKPKAGSFTQLFGAPSIPSGVNLAGSVSAAPSAPAPPAPAPPPPISEPATPPTSAPGSFTQLFSAPNLASPAIPRTPASAPTPGPATSGSTAPVATATNASAPPTGSASPDSLSKQFGSPIASSAAESSPTVGATPVAPASTVQAPPPAATPQKAAAEPGDFTRMFAASAVGPAKGTAPVPPPPAPSGLTPASATPPVSTPPSLVAPGQTPPSFEGRRPNTPTSFAPPTIPNRPAAPAAPPAPVSPTSKAPPAPAPSPMAQPIEASFNYAAPEPVRPAAKPPGEFTMMFGAPATAAPLPEHSRPSPMREAPPPQFSALTPDSQLQSPPVEPLHRVMSGNPNYASGINQGGASPIAPNVVGGQLFGLSPNAPVVPQPGYPAAHASPLFAKEKQLAGEPSATPGILPPPIFSSGSSTPLSSLGGAAPRISANAGPSAYTQMISQGKAPVVPALAPSVPVGTESKAGRKRLPTGLIVVINAVLLIAALLLFFVLRQPVPTAKQIMPAAPVMPNMPTAPKIPTGH